MPRYRSLLCPAGIIFVYMLQKGFSSSLGPVNFITGLSDGLVLPVIPFALLLTGYGDSTFRFLVMMLLLSLCGGLAYGLARYLGELEEIKHNHPELAAGEQEKDALRLKQIGIDESIITDMMQQVDREQVQWLQEIEDNDMDWSVPDTARARSSGWQTAMGFALGSVITLLPFLLLHVDSYGVPLFFAVLICGWTIAGWLKGYWIGKKPAAMAGAQVAKGLLMLALLLLLLRLFLQETSFIPFIQFSAN